MLIRIVKMSFIENKVEQFLANFNANKVKIRNTKGCNLLELYRDRANPNIFFTYSYWDTEQDLEHYRNSELFTTIWARTKELFNAKPEAWSVDRAYCLD